MKLQWNGPFRIRDLLEKCLDDAQPWPPAGQAVYLVSRFHWSGAPSKAALPLYFGANTGASERFCTRIGDLMADLFGFWDGGTGHHSGGQSLYGWCKENRVHPGDLCLAWATSRSWCARCAEVHLAGLVAPDWTRRKEQGLLNERRPPACTVHPA